MDQTISKSEFDAMIKRLDEVRDKEIKRIDEENNRQNHRLDQLESKVHDLRQIIISVEKMATHMENIDKEQAEQGLRLEKLESRDGETWRTVVRYIITAVVGGVVAYILMHVGL